MTTDKETIINLNEQQRRLIYIRKNFEKILCQISSFDIQHMNVFNVNFTQSVYNWVYDISNQPICLCGQKLKFKNFKFGYNKFCSKKCTMSDVDLVKNRNLKSLKTNIERWGVTNPMKVDDIKNKVKKTNKEKYGVENYTQTVEYIEKVKKTNFDKYGTEWFMSSDEFRDKSKKTNIEKTGHDHHTKSENFKNQIKKSNIEKWGVDNFSKTDDFKRKMSDYFQSDDFSQNQEKQKKLIKSKTFDYYKNYNSKYELKLIENNEIILTCGSCKSDFTIQKQLFYLRIKNNVEVCTNCNNKYTKNISSDETSLLNFIKTQYNLEILTNEKSIISPLEIDIYLPDIKLAFEFNGLYWHSELHKIKNYHLEKSNRCNDMGIQLIHIWEDDWTFKQDIVKSMIVNKVGLSKKIFARKCEIREITDNKTIRTFLDNNHLQGYIGSRFKIGLYHNDELVSLMTFGNLRKSMRYKSKINNYEMIRFCNKKYHTIVGGAKKLLKYFVMKYHPDEIISFSDYSRSNGDLYKKLGFDFSHLSNPGYYWCKNKIRNNRFSFRKDILVKEGFDPTKSESEIMYSRNYFKIHDCGMMKWILKK